MNTNLKLLTRLQRVCDLSMFYAISVSPYRIHLQGDLNRGDLISIQRIMKKRKGVTHQISDIGSIEIQYKNIYIILL
jgi:hypothetical protein